MIKQHCEFLDENEMLRLVEAFRNDFEILVASPFFGNDMKHSITADEEHSIRGSAGMIGARYIAENIKFLTTPISHAASSKLEVIRLSKECIEQLNKAVQCIYRESTGDI
ncbi:hypothetical protein KIH45_17725 [Croceicoccus sp. 1NDH52]|nr:hypothetical protein [Croceicoccus gelatinilyticus]